MVKNPPGGFMIHKYSVNYYDYSEVLGSLVNPKAVTFVKQCVELGTVSDHIGASRAAELTLIAAKAFCDLLKKDAEAFLEDELDDDYNEDFAEGTPGAMPGAKQELNHLYRSLYENNVFIAFGPNV
jgi:hypothetical protein